MSNKRFDPDMIDLAKYETLLTNSENELMPPPAIPYGVWTEEEVVAMIENRQEAKLVYNRHRKK